MTRRFFFLGTEVHGIKLEEICLMQVFCIHVFESLMSVIVFECHGDLESALVRQVTISKCKALPNSSDSIQVQTDCTYS